MLARLNAQNEQMAAINQRGQQLMSNFDTDRAIHSGSEVAYRNGKALLQQGRKQLETMVGAETVAGLHMAAPLLARAGRGVQGGYQLYQTAAAAQDARVLNARQRGIAKGVEARSRRFGDPVSTATEGTEGTESGLPDVIAQPLSTARGYFGQISARGDDGPSGSLSTDTGRNLRFNPATGGIETEGGAPALFGEERQAQFRTPLEQQAFENPNVGQRPVGIPAERQDFGDVDLTSRGARTRANIEFNQARQRAQTLPAQRAETLEGNLPERFNLPTEGIGSGAVADPLTAGARPRAQTIGEPRPIEPQVPPQSAPSYRRPGTQFTVRAQQPKPVSEDVSDPQGIGRLQDIAERYADRPEVNLPEPVEFQTRRLGVQGAETEASQVPSYSGVGLETGTTSFVPPAPRGAAPDLSSDTSLQRPTTTVDARTLNLPDVPSKPVGAPQYTEEEDARAIQEMLGVTPQAAPVNYAVEGAKIGGVDGTGGIPGVKFPGQAAADAGNDTTRTGQVASMNPAADAAARQDAANAADPAYQAQLKAALPKPPASTPGGGVGASAAEGAEGAEGAAATGAAEAGAEVAGEALAASIPGVGEVLGGILGIGSLLFGAHESSKTPAPPPPKPQPQGMPSISTAFDAAPVFDSSDYHAL